MEVYRGFFLIYLALLFAVLLILFHNSGNVKLKDESQDDYILNTSVWVNFVKCGIVIK